MEEGRGWRWDRIGNLIPYDTKSRLASYVLSEGAQDEDRLGWRLNDSGDFSVRSAYEAMVACEQHSETVDWKLIWRL